jgi:hypothetical protein
MTVISYEHNDITLLRLYTANKPHGVAEIRINSHLAREIT